MQQAFLDLRVKAIIILESLNHTTEDELTIKDQFLKSIDESLNKLFTSEFVVTTPILLPLEVIERLKTIIDEEASNLLQVMSWFNSLPSEDNYYFDPFIYEGNKGLSVFSVGIENPGRRDVRDDERIIALNPQRQLREKVAILFKHHANANDEVLSIQNELSESINRCLKNLFTLEFVERTKPLIKRENLMDLDKILGPEVFEQLIKNSPSVFQFMDYSPPIISYCL